MSRAACAAAGGMLTKHSQSHPPGPRRRVEGRHRQAADQRGRGRHRRQLPGAALCAQRARVSLQRHTGSCLYHFRLQPVTVPHCSCAQLSSQHVLAVLPVCAAEVTCSPALCTAAADPRASSRPPGPSRRAPPPARAARCASSQTSTPSTPPLRSRWGAALSTWLQLQLLLRLASCCACLLA